MVVVDFGCFFVGFEWYRVGFGRLEFVVGVGSWGGLLCVVVLRC